MEQLVARWGRWHDLCGYESMPYKDLEVRRQKQKDYQAKHYVKKKEYYKRKAKENKKKIIAWYVELKKTLSCVKCGENHPACLDFHHIDPKTKERLISGLPRDGWSKERILKEIKKCVVLCANCHRKEHFYSAE